MGFQQASAPAISQPTEGWALGRSVKSECRDERDYQAASRARQVRGMRDARVRTRLGLHRFGNPAMRCTGVDAPARSAGMSATVSMPRSP